MILTYKKYILKEFVKSLIKILAVFFFLIVISNLFEELSFVEKLNLNPLYPLFLSVLNAPSVIFDILPFIFLISTQFFFINLAEKDEFSIFKLNGLTNFKILNLVSIFSFIIGILAILFFYTFSSSLKNHYLEIKNNLTTDKKYLAVITDNGLWIKDEIDGIISITNADKINNNFLNDVSIVQFDKDFNLIKTIICEKINIENKLLIFLSSKLLLITKFFTICLVLFWLITAFSTFHLLFSIFIFSQIIVLIKLKSLSN